MKKNFIGRFYFKLTDSKNLIGEFSNSSDNRIYAESADRIAESDNGISKDCCNGIFVGKYNHTWCHYSDDGSVEGVVAKLTIDPKSPNIFSLTWVVQNDNNGLDMFWGEGMLCDGMLIGDYRNFEKY